MSEAEGRRAWARPFAVITSWGERYNGAEFPSGRVILEHSDSGFATIAASMEALLDAPDRRGATVERPEETSGE